MNVNLLTNFRRFVVVLAMALLLAATAATASVWLDTLTGTALTIRGSFTLILSNYSGGGNTNIEMTKTNDRIGRMSS